MPFFKFRRGDSASVPPAGSAAQALSVEVMRKRAKHRLIGASVLVLLGVVGFPLLFDTQPRPVAVDIPIEIPGKNSVKPLVLPAAPLPLRRTRQNACPCGVTRNHSRRRQLVAQEEIYRQNQLCRLPACASCYQKRSETGAQAGSKTRGQAQGRTEA